MRLFGNTKARDLAAKVEEKDRCKELVVKAKMFGFRCHVRKIDETEAYRIYSVTGDRPNWQRELFLNQYIWKHGYGAVGSGLLFIVVSNLDEAATCVDEMCSMTNV